MRDEALSSAPVSRVGRSSVVRSSLILPASG
jgi:hypothetical protein